jgi:RNA polymerase sigma factor (TIGR02999 family)
MSSISSMSDTAPALNGLERRERQATSDLLPLVYEELRKLATHKLANEAPGQTLQPTALVHEAWLRLVQVGDPNFQNRAHFFAAAAEAMRRILIDNARRKRALRHGGGQQRIDIQHVDLASTGNDDQMLAVNEALDKLTAQNKMEAELVKLHYFVGLTLEESAQVLGVSARTADNYWAHARAWLFRELKNQQG